MAISLAVKRAHRFEDLVGVREIRLCLFDNAAESLEDVSLRVDDARDLTIDGQSSQVVPPGDADAFEVAPERERESAARLAERDRRSWIGTRQHAQKQRQIADGSCHRTVDAQR